jgi:GNAT superfamily N-acetyltransferase
MAIRIDHQPVAVLTGPEPIRTNDIDALNALFSAAFTERYRRDGLVGVRVPALNPVIWQYAIQGAGSGAMLWRDPTGAIAAFNIAHASGAEGWMGPLAVRDDCQGGGWGKRIVRAGIEHLRATGCRTIGLETMPRTVDNIGFYSGLGFIPGHLTVTLTLDASGSPAVPGLLSLLGGVARVDAMAACAALSASLVPGADYTREIRLTHELSLGDTLLHYRDRELAGFALCHAAPLVESRARDELRVLKLVASDHEAFKAMLPGLSSLARRTATTRVALRMQGEHRNAYAAVVRQGGRVRWTDLRMTLNGYPQVFATEGVALTNWEI